MLFTAFKLKQTSIIEKLCVNKANPEMKCDGKCYLRTQFEKTNQEDSSSDSKILFELVQELSDFCQDFMIIDLNNFVSFSTIKWAVLKGFWPEIRPISIFHPPD